MLPSLTVIGACALALVGAATAQLVNPTIAQINGNKFLSQYNGSTVSGLRGLVTAVGPSGFWIRSMTPDNDPTTSESIYVFGASARRNATVGNVVSLNGRVTEHRSSSSYLYLTEIDRPSNITILSTGHAVVPLVLGQDSLNPPTEQFSSLDNGDVFAVPNNQSQISVVNPTLNPVMYGLDFWESLTGELVTITNARAISKPNQFGNTWVVGNWSTTGESSRGGLAITKGDANPEAIVIGDPLDGTNNPDDTKLGDSLEDIIGVLTYAFGFYTILPVTKITITGSRIPALPPPTNLTSTSRCNGVTVGQYNVENLFSGSPNLDDIAYDIVNFLRSPDLLFVQEIQDDNGPTNDGVVDANITLAALRDAINAASSRTNYSFTSINPTDSQDGGQPGGNIRTAYLYNSSVLRLRNANPGTSMQATRVLPGPSLLYNPGLIEPSNPAWRNSRKPLAAHWETLDGLADFFTVNVHLTSKGGSSSLHGDARPPVNGGVEQRTAQTNATGAFVAQILRQDPLAAIVTAGDFNEFRHVQPLETFESVSGLADLDTVVGTPPSEVYTYLFGGNAQELDHMFVSPRLANRTIASFEHVHVNTWMSFDEQASDHDPSVAKFNFCETRADSG